MALDPTRPPDEKLRTRYVLRAVVLLILAGGGALSWWRADQADQRLRQGLLHQTTLISWALNAEQVDGLSGSEADLEDPAYQRLKTQLVEARQLFPACRFLYVMRRDDHGLVRFLADSEPAGSDDYSPPGQTYEEATEVLRGVFRTRRAATEGPVADRWGTWISSLVPLYHPRNDRVVGVLGMDLDASRWRAQVWRAARAPLIFSALLLLALGASRFYAGRGKPVRSLGPWSRDTILAAVVGLILTALATYLAVDGESALRHESFRRVATTQAGLLQQALTRVEDTSLEGLGRFFEGGEFVDRREFDTYAGFLLNRSYAQSWRWLPAVLGEAREAFERAVRDSGIGDFQVWERNAGGDARAAGARGEYFPITYVAPQTGNEVVIGFDDASDPPRREALETARATRLATGTDPIALMSNPDRTNAVIVYRPVYGRGDPDRFVGFVSVAVRMDTLLARALSRDSTRDDDVTVVSLHALQGGRPGALLAANDEKPAPLPADALALPDGAMGRSLSLVAPVFAHGKAYAFTARPGRPFYELYPGRALHRTLGTGFLLTTLLTTLVALLAGRRQHLEQQVEERTRALRASESSYHGLFNFIRQAIYIQDPEGRFLDVNDGAVAMYGYSREEIVGQTPEFLSAPGRNDPAALAARLHSALEGQPQFFEFWGRRRNGEVFPKDVWVCRGTYFGRTVLIAVANDVSDRKRAEADKDRLQSQLVQAQKMESVGRLAGGVAHDFNNMLQAILGNTSLALESAPAGDLREYLEEIRRSAQRSADLTRQLLAFASRQTVSPRVIDLNDTISGMLKMLRRLIGEDIQLLWAPGSDLWPVKVDPSQVDQILANLAVNARDAIGGVGRVTIETANLVCTEGTLPNFPGCAPGEYVMIVVRDTGKGMDEETRAHIFEPFYTTKAPGKGVGLGLATVFGIVKQNHGFIHVQSEPGAGTVFQIGLPRTHLAPEPSPTAMPQARAQGGCETLLLVEDEGSILRFGREALGRLGYEVLASSSPREALELARRHPRPIHLLITDVVLPEMNGRELAQTLSAMYPAVRCLFMSGYTADVIAERGVLDEHVNFIQKPFHPDALAARIREILDEAGPA